MIKKLDNEFLLTNSGSSLILHLNELGKLTMEYYGAPLPEGEDLSKYVRKNNMVGTATIYDEKKDKEFSLDTASLEFSTPHKGDYGDPSIILASSKGFVYDFVYEKDEIRKPKEMKDYPNPREAEEELVITFVDEKMGARIHLHYITYKNSAIFGRYLEIENFGEEEIRIQKAASLQLILDDKGYEMVTYYGGWADEFHENVSPITHVRTVIDSLTGSSSARHNPFFYVRQKGASVDSGETYAFNLIYSGNHFEEAELTTYGKIRIQTGISSICFEERLPKGGSFTTPLAIMAYSNKGQNGITKFMHEFVNDHVVPARFQGKDKLIDYNSWEGSGTKFKEKDIHSLMKKAASIGVELFVLDDGWFGHRNDDSTSLGDWVTDKKKLPHGIDGLANYAHKLGMQFGLWFEPEMISPDSDLYRAHPDWAIQDGIHEPSLGRHQLVLDLRKQEVQDFIVEVFDKFLGSGKVNFVKWDYNRNISDIPAGDGAFYHNYILGLYKVLKRLDERFPDVLFQNCASGGNRCDLGMLSFFPLTWVSDDTDPFQRAQIQESMAVGYPLSVFANHVSSKTNTQALRVTTIHDKFEVASLGVLGYELNLNDVSKEDIEIMKKQIGFYKCHRRTFQYGEYRAFHKLSEGNIAVRQVLGEKEAVVVRTLRNQQISGMPESLEVKGLDETKNYAYSVYDKKLELKRFGPLVNMVSPIHLKEDGFLLRLLSKFKKMDIEEFKGVASGAYLNAGAVKLPNQWQAAGYDSSVAFYGDFGSRLILVQETN